ncbi:carbohydrate ABC transporter permease [Cryobacterium sp. TMT1-3]|uniref:Carbohydrate ABC transporter permease n=1 Tax=Cryobacterium luteum TaxID=1424661 RepID=A0A1H8HVF6_9MICO|nr:MULTISPECIES: carbohydrate ABC transporter permease [Cryobacterium]TFB94202.1 carbohydrate ABC transporter permease [Cryobacterium luteum]TFC26840.1 carbohydrate ABC transporter permease [Cryobacterium sp. TMT1-3]SEN60021.1 carbohydrate ABC transporter membrane protein 2, CUT1 family [Cryobacterium luteum]
MKWTKFGSTAAIYLVLLLGALLTLGPFLLSILTAFKTREQFAQQSALSWPDPFTVENFAQLLTGPAQFGRAIVITVLAAMLILVGQLICSILAAYAFARVDFPGRQVLFWVYLSTLMIPPVVLVVPLYLMMTEAGLRNSFWSLVLPFAFASPYAIFLLREYFRGIPQELIDAARLDGANTLDVLVEIVVPLSRPIIATLTLITIVSHWNSFMWPLVVTTGTEWRVVTVATASLQSQFNGNWTLVMAATTLALVPLLVLFLLFQRSFVRSITIAGSA